VIGVLIAAAVIGVPALAFVLWPLLRRGDGGGAFLAVPPDGREQLLEQKRRLLRSLRELAFEHESGHVSDDDHAELRARYEAETAAVLNELDQLGSAAPPPPQPVPPPPAARSRGWRHPAAVTAGAVALVVFGIALGAGVVRYTTPDSTAGTPMAGPPPLADVAALPPGTPSGGAGRELSPEMLQGMLQAAQASLLAGRYGEAIAAYQAVLKRQPQNVDALTHLALIVAIGGHADTALETLDRALAVDPNYPPALLYRGQVLWETKGDAQGAIVAWEKFLAVTPAGEDRDRVKELIAQAKAGRRPGG
jgi:tetratricopeptide (TPR) repeat protein